MEVFTLQKWAVLIKRAKNVKCEQTLSIRLYWIESESESDIASR